MDVLDNIIADHERLAALPERRRDNAAITALAALRSARAQESMALGATVWHPVRSALGIASHEPESALAAAVLRYIEEHPAKIEALEPPLDIAGIAWPSDVIAVPPEFNRIHDHSDDCQFAEIPGADDCGMDVQGNTLCIPSCPVGASYAAYLAAVGSK